jgi:acyl-CoA thioesterase
MGHPPWEHYVPTTSERAQYQRFDHPAHLPDGTVDPLALVVLCDMMPGAVAERLGQPIEHSWYGPSADLTVHILGTATSEWILTRNRAHRAGGGYASVEIEVWDPATGLVAYGTQTMIFTFDGPAPEGHLRLPLDLRPSTPS